MISRVRVIRNKSQTFFKHLTMILMAFAHSFGLFYIQCRLSLSIMFEII